MLARLGELIWQISGKKWTYLTGRFCFHILKNMAQNNLGIFTAALNGC